MEAAVRLVLEHGTADLVRLGLHDLCESVGLSTTSFYQAFDSIGSFHKSVASTMLSANASRLWHDQADGLVKGTIGKRPEIGYAIAAWLEHVFDVDYHEPWAWATHPEIHDGLSEFRIDLAQRYAALTGYVASTADNDASIPPESTPAAALFLNDADLMTRGLTSTVTWTDIDDAERETTLFTAMFRGVVEGLRDARLFARHSAVLQCTRVGCEHEYGSCGQSEGLAANRSAAMSDADSRLKAFAEDLVATRRAEIRGALKRSGPAPAGDSEEVRKLREQFVQGVLTAAFPDPLRNLSIYKVAREASLSPSTLSYQFADIADMRLQAFAELVARVRTDPADDIIHSLEAAVLEGETGNQIIARYLRACSRQLAEDPMYPFLVGASAKRAKPEVEDRYTQAIVELGRSFGMPLRIALARSDLDVSGISRGLFNEMVQFSLLTGASAHFLTMDRYRYRLRGVDFEAGGAALASTLWLLLGIQPVAAGEAANAETKRKTVRSRSSAGRATSVIAGDVREAAARVRSAALENTAVDTAAVSSAGIEHAAVQNAAVDTAAVANAGVDSPDVENAAVGTAIGFDPAQKGAHGRPATASQRQGEHAYPRRAGVAAAADLALALQPGDLIPLSVAEVCAAAGTGASAFYRAFGSADTFRDVAISALLKHRLDGPEKLRTYVTSMAPYFAQDWIAFCHGLATVTQTHLDRDSHMQTWGWARNPYVAHAIASHVDDVVTKTIDPQLRLFAEKGRRPLLAPAELIKACRQVNDAWVVTGAVLSPIQWTDFDGLERTTEVHSLGIRAMLDALLVEDPPAIVEPPAVKTEGEPSDG